jgi:23S rRNA (adenine2030-N6)-methyltransferase
MLSYRHIYHAGNFADVVKHVVLSLLTQALLAKDKPFCFVDTHAGAGRYDLLSAAAQKNQEFLGGIGRVWAATEAPPQMEGYRNAVAALNPDRERAAPNAPRYYPGSPRIVRHLMRPQDRMVLAELHPSEVRNLRKEFAGDRRVALHHLDGYQGVKAFLPPRERRGLVLVDPAFELKDESGRFLAGLRCAHQRWPTGTLVGWYPIQAGRNSLAVEDLKASDISKMLHADFCILPADVPKRLNGCGMVIINPPWRLEEDLRVVLPWLWGRLAISGQGTWSVGWLVSE